MRAPALAAAFLLPLTSAALSAPQSGETVRYFMLSGTLVGDVDTDASLMEKRRGTTVTAATLDLCFGSVISPSRKERVVVELTPTAGRLAGTGRTQIGNEPVTVQLTRTQVEDRFNFGGTIRIGQEKPYEVNSTDNNDISADEYKDSQATDEIIFSAPSVFAEPGPGTVGVRVKLESLAGLVKALKGENTRVRVESLQPDCQALRSREMVVQMEVDPLRSAALVDKLKSVPGVIRTGWTSGTYGLDNAVRVPRAEFGGATIDRDKLTAAVAASAAKSLSATVDATKFDDVTGEVLITLKRPSLAYAAIGLTDRISLTFMVGPEKLGSTEALVVWLGTGTVEPFDEGAEPRLKFVRVPDGSPAADYIDMTPVRDTVRDDLKGKIWDSDATVWK